MHFEIWWLLAFSVVMTVLVGIFKIAMAFIHRRDARTLPADIERRLARIEHAMESTALEVERIGENQRYLTRLLTDGAADRGAGAGAQGRVVTPH